MSELMILAIPLFYIGWSLHKISQALEKRD